MTDHDTDPWNDEVVVPWYVPAIILAAFVGLIAGMLWAFRAALSATPRERELMRELMADPFVVFTANPEWTLFLLAVGAVPLVLFAIYTWRMRRDGLTHVTADGQISVPGEWFPDRPVQGRGVRHSRFRDGTTLLRLWEPTTGNRGASFTAW